MDLPERFIEIQVIPKHSNGEKLPAVYDSKSKEIIVFTEQGFATWEQAEFKESFQNILSLDGFELQQCKN